MKLALLALVLLTTTAPGLLAESYEDDARSKENQAVADLGRSAAQAALAAGADATGSISCDRFFISCTCKGAFHCAWLAWACGEAGGIQGFDGECFFPSSVPSAEPALQNFKSRVGRGAVEASCDDGPFCHCSGPATSDDCKKITGCADKLLCVGGTCTCAGGTTD